MVEFRGNSPFPLPMGKAPVKTQKLSSFQRAVYALCLQIPAGKVSTYATIACALKKPGGSIAVGQALKRNPFAPIVPCHRVLRSDLSIGGFHGQVSGPEIDRKVEMLLKEEVPLRNVDTSAKGVKKLKLVDESSVFGAFVWDEAAANAIIDSVALSIENEKGKDNS